MGMKFGLLLPPFGEFADRDLILEGSKQAETLGFDSVWVRDHLLFEPHGEFESAAKDFFEPLTVLTAIGAVTKTISLGTATLGGGPAAEVLGRPLRNTGRSRRHPDRRITGRLHHGSPWK